MRRPVLSRDRADALLAAALIVLIGTEALTSDWREGSVGLTVLLVAVMVAPVAVRRRRPLAASCVTLAGAMAVSAWATPVNELTTAIFLLVVMPYPAGRQLAMPRAAWGLALGVAMVCSVDIIDGVSGPSDYLFPSLIAALSWLTGRDLRNRALLTQELAQDNELLEAERERHAAAVVTRERARIARELHDVVAHSVSVMVVQSGGARRVLESDPAAALQALGAVEDTGRVALVELRRLLGIMRQDEEPAPLSPQPGLDQLGELAGRARAAGLPVALRVAGEPGSLPAGVDLTAYRVVQEALTNAIKHAAGAHATVDVRWSGEALEIEVTDTGGAERTADDAGAGDGHGLVGMRERVALYGGELYAGPGPRGGFVVRARLPRVSEVVA
jgi:signal transduction histidine kinase